MGPERVRIQTDDFDLSREVAALREHDAGVGAVASFVGTVRERSDGATVSRMELEHYPGMTERSIEAMIDAAMQRFDIRAARVVHRVGTLEVGAQIVLVAVTSAHRGQAFEACEFLMDYLKTQAPFLEEGVDAARLALGRRTRRRRSGPEALGHQRGQRVSPTLAQAACVIVGASLGALLRWATGLWLNPLWHGFPLGTLAVNTVGGLMIGLASAWLAQHPHPLAHLLLVTGFLGGLTTFSAFSIESLNLIQRGEYATALVHTGAHLLGALACCALGFALGQQFFGQRS